MRKQILFRPLQNLGVFEWRSSRIGFFRSTEVTKVCGRKRKSSCEVEICVDVKQFFNKRRKNAGKKLRQDKPTHAHTYTHTSTHTHTHARTRIQTPSQTLYTHTHTHIQPNPLHHPVPLHHQNSASRKGKPLDSFRTLKYPVCKLCASESFLTRPGSAASA